MPLASFIFPSVAEDEDLLLLQFRSISSELGRYRRLVAAVATHRSVVVGVAVEGCESVVAKAQSLALKRMTLAEVLPLLL